METQNRPELKVIIDGIEYEPKPKPEPAKEQFKVGDWVEFNYGNNPKQVEIVEIDGDNLYYNTRYAGITIKAHIYTSAIIRKLSPSEVIVDFGSGIKGRVCMPYAEWGFGVLNDHNDWIAQIDPDALDAPIRELVEGLLKAQEDK